MNLARSSAHSKQHYSTGKACCKMERCTQGMRSRAGMLGGGGGKGERGGRALPLQTHNLFFAVFPLGLQMALAFAISFCLHSLVYLVIPPLTMHRVSSPAVDALDEQHHLRPFLFLFAVWHSGASPRMMPSASHTGAPGCAQAEPPLISGRGILLKVECTPHSQ